VANATPLTWGWLHRTFVRCESDRDVQASDLELLVASGGAPKEERIRAKAPEAPATAKLPLALKLSFNLPSSTYATMLIRQLTLLPSSPAFQRLTVDKDKDSRPHSQAKKEEGTNTD